jgi:hypothetical protein
MQHRPPLMRFGASSAAAFIHIHLPLLRLSNSDCICCLCPHSDLPLLSNSDLQLALSNIGRICCFCPHSDLPLLSNSDCCCRPCPTLDLFAAIVHIRTCLYCPIRTAAAGLVTLISLQSATFIWMHLHLCNQQQAIARRLPALSPLYLCNQQHSFRCIYISAISSRQSHGGCRPCHIDISAIISSHLDAFISLQLAAGNRTAAAGLVTFISLQSAAII